MKNTHLIFALISLLILSSCGSSEEEITKVESQNIPVNVLNIEAKTFDHFIEVTGNVEPVQYAYISPEGTGQIKKIFVSEGDKVQKGSILAQLNTSVIEGQIQQIKSQLDLAVITFDKQNKLWNEQHVGSEIQFLQAKAQKEGLESQLKSLNSQKEMSIIRAPFSGIIDNINAKEGELASPGMKIIELVNLNKMKVKAQISESLLPSVHKGDSVLLSFPTYENIKIKAPVYRTGNVINSSNRTFTVEIRIDNIKNQLKPFMISKLKIKDYSVPDAISIPSIVIKKDFDKEFVFTAKQSGQTTIAKKTYIQTGRSFKGNTLITKGLEEKNLLIVKGYNTVSDEVRIDILK